MRLTILHLSALFSAIVVFGSGCSSSPTTETKEQNEQGQNEQGQKQEQQQKQTHEEKPSTGAVPLGSIAGVGQDRKLLIDGVCVVSEHGDGIWVALTTFSLDDSQRAEYVKQVKGMLSSQGRPKPLGDKPYIEFMVLLADASLPAEGENIHMYQMGFANFANEEATLSEQGPLAGPKLTGDLKDGSETQFSFEKHSVATTRQGDSEEVYHCLIDQKLPVFRVQPPKSAVELGKSKAGVGEDMISFADKVAFITPDSSEFRIIMSKDKLSEKDIEYFSQNMSNGRSGRTPVGTVELDVKLFDSAKPPTRDNIKQFRVSYNGFGELDHFDNGTLDGFIDMATSLVPTVTGEYKAGSDITVSIEFHGRIRTRPLRANPEPHHFLLNETVTLLAEPPVKD